MPGDSELGSDIEKSALPNDRTEANVNRGQQPVCIGDNEVCGMRVDKIIEIHAGGESGRGTDRERGSHPESDDIRRVDLRARNFMR